ncbi:STAS-like domain-containing protein [Amycolatopsis magusensis]|uniref:STAS-like domain-containing protein n=1 Tax=Amycolatopsis magusensis TaxID=882444 RepID=UPI0024A89D70|nr:DUF4325 domain-containing protein [Amycolatopsis magusensis]MDI5975474.1 DUF4325 domain-containing protein [Amycolatopsis magusensis]
MDEHGSYLATRSVAKLARESLEHEVAAGAQGGELLVDFTGVDAMTISFADEFLGKFYGSVAAGDVAASVVLLQGLNEETLETIQICLERRELMAATVDGEQLKLLAAPEYLGETYRQAVVLRRFRAAELSERLGVTLQNVNNRLKRLVSSGTLKREKSIPSNRGGKEFVYTIPASWCGGVA